MSCTEIDAYREASSAIKKFLGNYINMESSIIEYKFIKELLTRNLKDNFNKSAENNFIYFRAVSY